MKIIKGCFFYGFVEVKELLLHRYQYEIHIETVKRRVNNFGAWVEIGKSRWIPEEILPLLKEDLTLKANRDKIKKEIRKIIEKYEILIEEYEKEN